MYKYIGDNYESEYSSNIDTIFEVGDYIKPINNIDCHDNIYYIESIGNINNQSGSGINIITKEKVWLYFHFYKKVSEMELTAIKYNL